MAATKGGAFNFCELPEGCIAEVLALTSPREVCRLSSVSPTFKSAAYSDAVWRRFLPSDFESIIAGFPDLRRLSLKELYFKLCSEPILIDDSKKSFSLERLTGKKFYMLSASDLKIVWGDIPVHCAWTCIAHPKPRFPVVASLERLPWLEIHGKINVETLSSSTRYRAYFVFSTYGDNGFVCHLIEAGIKLPACVKPTVRDVDLHSRVRLKSFSPGIRSRPCEFPKERSDEWWEVKIGEFVTRDGVEEGEVEMSLLEVRRKRWEGGLIIHGIEIRPKDDKGNNQGQCMFPCCSERRQKRFYEWLHNLYIQK